ncbi:MAG TPA: RluA family pseudouridine synthase [Vulgatibacter sp.]
MLPSDDGERIDRFLAARAGISRGEARRALERGGVYLDSTRCKIASKAVRAGQQVAVVLEEAGRVQAAAAEPLRILHEDELVLAVDKSAGVPSQATLSGDVGTLPWLVARHLGCRPAEVATVHRLDRDTSGVVVFGRTRAATSALAKAFREGTAHKEYLAIVVGRLVGSGRLDGPIAPVTGRRGSFEVREGGVPAVTRWEAFAHDDDLVTAVRLFPETGRTHQLRVHLSHLGHPILADARYGGPRRAGALEPPRMLLHASVLELPHPGGGALRVEASSPPDLAAALAALEP